MRLLLFAVCSALLSYGIFRAESPPELFEHSDKALHLLAFGALALTARLAFPQASGWLLWSGLLALAPLLEWLQKFVQPARQFSELDIAANLLGVLLACLAWYMLQTSRRHRLPSQ